MKKYFVPVLIMVVGVSVGVFLFRPYSQRKIEVVKPAKNILCDFEKEKVWDVSPEKGFDLSLSKSHVMEGKHSLKVVFPQGGLPSINTRKFNPAWGSYDYFSFDVYHSQPEDLNFTIRLDDTTKKRVNIPYTLRNGLNRIRIARVQIASQIDPANIGFIVLFLNEPSKRYTLYFDNMRLEKIDLIDGLETVPIETLEKKAEQKKLETPLPVRTAVAVPKPIVPKTGELRVPLAKLKKTDDNRPLISTGVPFALGQLMSEKDVSFLDKDQNEIPVAVKVLARWPQDNSIRSLLVQFRYSIPNIYQYVTMRWGEARKTTDLAIVEPNGDFPEGYIVLPAPWLCSSGIIGEQLPMGKSDFPDYDSKIEKNFADMRDKGWTGDLIKDGYYSTPHVFYQFYVRSGDLKYFLAARKELLHYRETQLILEGKERGRSIINSQGRYIYLDAMAEDYLLTGDPRSLEVAGYMAEFLKNNYSPSWAFYPKNQTNFFTEREIAFPFLGIVTYYELTGKSEYLKIAQQYMENLYKTQLEWPSRGGFIHNLYAHDTEEGCRQDEYGGSPFMSGLLLEAVIEYHRLTGDEKAADSIFRALDWLMNEGLVASGDSFKYLTCDQYSGSTGDPDLNLLIVHAFGYGYRLSGYTNENYLAVGKKVLDRGIKNASLVDRKHFNQNYRSSGHFLAYIQNAPRSGMKISTGMIEEPTTSQAKNVFYFDDFESTRGRFSSPGDVTFEMDSQNTYLNGSSLNIKSKYLASGLSAGVEFENWDIESYPKVSFAYRIPDETPVGMRLKTEYGDWICIGGTKSAECADALSAKTFTLEDDNSWHEIELDVQASARAVLSRLKGLKGFQFYTNSNAGMDDQFWIDDFKIRK